jgi:hypothetical protein
MRPSSTTRPASSSRGSTTRSAGHRAQPVGRPLPLLGTVRRAAPQGRSEGDCGLALPADQRQEGRVFHRDSAENLCPSLTFGPTPQQLGGMAVEPAEIDQRVQRNRDGGHDCQGRAAAAQRRSASLGLVADSLRMLPTKEQAKNKTWSATEWAETARVGSSLRPARPSARRCARCTAFGSTCWSCGS